MIPEPSIAADGPAQAAHLFVVDDDPALVDSLVELLIDEGYRAEGFTRPREALERLRSGARPRALLLDYIMPEMTGDEFLAELAAAGVNVPVLLLSGLNEPSIRTRVAGVLPKPFDIDRLLASIVRLIGPAPG